MDVRITNFDAPSSIQIGSRTQSFFPMITKRRRNTSNPAWTNAGISLPLVLCGGVLGNEAKVVVL